MRRLNNYMERQKILDHMMIALNSSMVGYEVLGTPEHRRYVLLGIANYMLNRMSEIQRLNYIEQYRL